MDVGKGAREAWAGTMKATGVGAGIQNSSRSDFPSSRPPLPRSLQKRQVLSAITNWTTGEEPACPGVFRRHNQLKRSRPSENWRVGLRGLLEDDGCDMAREGAAGAQWQLTVSFISPIFKGISNFRTSWKGSCGHSLPFAAGKRGKYTVEWWVPQQNRQGHMGTLVKDT